MRITLTKEEIMKTNAKMMVIGLVLAMVFCYAGTVWAESNTGTTSANARLNFRVTIAEYIEFRVGSPGAAVDEIQFSPSLADIQAPNVVSGSGGDLTGGEVTVRLLSNTSNAVTVTAYNPSTTGLWDGGTEYINYANIITTESGAGGLTPPILTNAGGNSTTLAAGPNDINTAWTYTYEHTTGPEPLPGTYTGQVTYTASAP